MPILLLECVDVKKGIENPVEYLVGQNSGIPCLDQQDTIFAKPALTHR